MPHPSKEKVIGFAILVTEFVLTFNISVNWEECRTN